MANIYISSDNLVTLDALTDAEAGEIDDATVAMSLFSQTTKSPDAGAAVDKGGGKVGIPATAHGLVAGVDYIRMEGSQNYNDEYAVDATTTENEIVITATYVAETFLGTETIYVGIRNGTNISMAAAGSGGKYTGILPDTLQRMVEYSASSVTFGGTTTTTGLFYLFIEAVKGAARMTKRIALQAVFDS